MQPPQIPFTLIIPGSPPITNFTETNGILHVDIPSTVSSLCLTLISPLPQNHALLLSVSAPPFTSMQHIGGVSNERPSQIFSTGFHLKSQYCQHEAIKVCLEVKDINSCSGIVMQTDGKKQYSKMVAQNLHNYMLGYNNKGLLINGVGDHLVIPADCLNKWLKLFQEKYRKDPNFIQRENYQIN